MASTFYVLEIDYGPQIGTDKVVADCNRAALLKDIMDGQYDRVLNVLEVNEGEGWVRNLSLDIAEEIAAKRERVSENVVAFIHRHAPALAREMDRRAA